jgi:hypothetical protein
LKQFPLRIIVLAAQVFICSTAFGQQSFHILPEIVDGVLPNGTNYKTTFIIVPWGETEVPICNVKLYGLSASVGGARSNSFTFNIPAGTYYVQQTIADQRFVSGYATVTCSHAVFTQAVLSAYSANGGKIAEATVPSTEGDSNNKAKMIADQRSGARLAVAIANNTDIVRTYQLTVGTLSGTVQVPARSAVATFVDEILPASAHSLGLLQVQSTDFSGFGIVGLRFTGEVFTTMPALF